MLMLKASATSCSQDLACCRLVVTVLVAILEVNKATITYTLPLEHTTTPPKGFMVLGFRDPKS